MENLLVSGFKETCGHDLDITKVGLLGSCSVLADDSQKIADLQSLHVSGSTLQGIRGNRGDATNLCLVFLL